jgi:HEPN domain-containing protein
MQRDRFAVARTWLISAERDVVVARLALEAEPALAAFHAQQAAEKSLKAAAIAVTGDHARTHSAGAIVSELRRLDIAFDAGVEADARALDLYYLASRYPDAVADNDPGDVVPVEDAKRALDRCARVQRFARQIVVELEANRDT